MDWLDLAVQGTPKSLLQHHSTKASILQHSALFTVQLSHPKWGNPIPERGNKCQAGNRGVTCVPLAHSLSSVLIILTCKMRNINNNRNNIVNIVDFPKDLGREPVGCCVNSNPWNIWNFFFFGIRLMVITTSQALASSSTSWDCELLFSSSVESSTDA